MRFKVKKIKISAGRPIVFLNKNAAAKLNVYVNDRVAILSETQKIFAIVDIIKDSLNSDEIYLSEEALDFLRIKAGNFVEVTDALEPKSNEYILKKMNGKKLNKKEIFAIIREIVGNHLSEAEISYFVSAVYHHGMDMEETKYLIEAICKTGQILSWHSKQIADKHSIGGIPGNRTTPIVVSICASDGIIMPKTSSRAITSAAGTADTIETIARVDFSAEELKKIVKKTNACLAWGGSLGLAPADDKLIRVERLLNIDPESQLIASILSKKLAVGSKYVLIDIPFGKGAKVNLKKAKILKEKFLRLSKYFKIKMEVTITDGKEPIGNGVGPVLEINDVIRVLRRENPPKKLEEKSVMLAGKIIEMLGHSKKGKGMERARELLESGAAYKKFEEIINAQEGKVRYLLPAKIKEEIKAKKRGKLIEINNQRINYIARILGCPENKNAGVYLLKHCGEEVREDDALMILYSPSSDKLKGALNYYYENNNLFVIK